MSQKNIVKILSFIFSLTFLNLHAERLVFSIDYFGISVATVEMKLEDLHHSMIENINPYLIDSLEGSKKLSVTAISSKVSGLLRNTFDNIYTCFTDRQFRPFLYEKVIHQSNFQEEAYIEYRLDLLQATYFDHITEYSRTYHILDTTRDFFSTLFYLRTLNLRENHILSLDVAGKIVIITTRWTGSETLRTNIGRVNTNKIEISFRSYDDTEKMRSDILTNNLHNEENKLFFWFTNDGRQIPVRSQYTYRPANIFWNIRSWDA